MNKLFLPCLTALAGFQSIPAQAATPTPPPEPPPAVVLKLAPGTECVASLSYPKPAPGEKQFPMPAQRIFLFTGVDASRTILMTDKRKLAEFIRGAYFLGWDSKTGIQVSELGDETAPPDFRDVHFPELAWVDPGSFRGIEKRGELKYFVFEGPDKQRLLVDMPTLLPALMESPAENYSYAYRDTGIVGTKVPLLPEIQGRWDKIKAAALKYNHVRLED